MPGAQRGAPELTVIQRRNTYLNPKEKTDVLALVPELSESLRLESDRGVVLVVATMVENALESHIERRLRPKVEPSDELMARSAMSPIGTFSAKINLAHRIGLISQKERLIFHQLRAIRNKCAHEVDSQTFGKDHFRSRILNLVAEAPTLWDNLSKNVRPPPFDEEEFASVEEFLDRVGWRRLFELFFSLIIAHKRVSIERVPSVRSLATEFA